MALPLFFHCNNFLRSKKIQITRLSNNKELKLSMEHNRPEVLHPLTPFFKLPQKAAFIQLQRYISYGILFTNSVLSHLSSRENN